MTHTTENAREAARQGDGKFGTQEHELPSRRLAESMAPVAEVSERPAGMTPEERADLNRNLYAIEAQMLAVRHQVDAATVASSIKEHYPDAATVTFYLEKDHGDMYVKDVLIFDANGQAVPAAPEWEKEPSSMVAGGISNSVFDDMYDQYEFYEGDRAMLNLNADEPAFEPEFCDDCSLSTISTTEGCVCA